jgi:membrane protein YqaA with SNARE-associated domain
MFDWSRDTSLFALFASAFLSATILPGNSEVVLFQVLRAHPQDAWEALAIATAGNTLGSMTTYALGRLLPNRPMNPRALEWLRRHGAIALLLAWLPVLGDALCAAAGWLRLHWARSLVFIAAGKFIRYLVVAQAAQFA